MTKYAIIPAPGYSGNVARIVSVHGTLANARKARGGAKCWAIVETDDAAFKGRTVYMDVYAGHRFDSDGVLRA